MKCYQGLVYITHLAYGYRAVPGGRAWVLLFGSASPPQNKRPLFALNAVTGFLRFKESGPFQLTKKHMRLYKTS
jgi:hypothetical protein